MSYGLPVIAPPVGGVRELVDQYVNGFLADYRELNKIAGHIWQLANGPALYRRLSEQALLKSELFAATSFRASIRAALEGQLL